MHIIAIGRARKHRYLPGAVTALVPLACCLSAYTKLRGDIGPADPEVNCTIDESIEFRLG